jgi:pimeloyl-ACP methyl ester carboxylesterase
MPTIQVRGERDLSGKQDPTVAVKFNDVIRSQVKDTVRLDRGRAAIPPVVLAQVADDDVVEVELDDGLKLWVRGADIEAELGAVRKRGDAQDLFEIPDSLPRRGQQRAIGTWLLKALTVIGIDPPKATAQELARQLEHRLIPEPGVCRWTDDGKLKRLGEGEAISGNGELLLFLHGTGSKTLGSFGALLGVERQREWQVLRENYGDRIFTLEHRTLSESPIANTITLVEKLPVDAKLHLVSHSRGGLVGELLCRAFIEGRDEPFIQDEIDLLKTVGQHQELVRLGALLKQKKPKVVRFVRVACPARGTILASERLDHYLTVILNLLALLPLPPPADEIYDFLKAFLLAVVKERTRPESIPGLEAMMPESPFQKIINRRAVVVHADLSVIKGDLQGQGIFTLSRLKELATDFFYLEDHDLVVNTSAMDGGSARAAGARTFLDQGPQVDHFSYFRNERTAEQLVRGLLRGPTDVTGFEPVSVRSAEPVTRVPFHARGGRGPTAVVVPDFAGTLLGVQGLPVWIKSDQLAAGGLGRLAIGEPGVLPQGLIDLYYDDLIRTVSVGYEVLPFPYDWRLSLWGEAARLAQSIDQRLSETPEPVHIVAHGMGGLLVRAAFAQKPPVLERLKQRKDARIVLVGVPHGGTYAVPLMLMGRDQATQMLSALDFKLDRERHLTILRDFPGLLEMLPRDGVFDLFAPTGWSSLHANDKLDTPWSPPNPDKLKAAAAVRDKIDAAPFDSESMLYVAGQDVTIDGITIAATDSRQGAINGGSARESAVFFTRTRDGDGRAPWKTGVLPGMRVWYSAAAHGDLVRDPQTIAAIIELLDRGATDRLSANPLSTRDQTVLKPIRGLRMEVFPDDRDLAAATMGGRITRPAAPRAKPIKIAVVHKNLAFARHPLIVGHYRGDTLAGAEAHVDRMLDRRLSNRRKLGLYPDAIGTVELILDATDRSRGAIVVGLGDAGRLTEGDLRRALTRGLLRYAAFWIEQRKAGGTGSSPGIEVSTLLIGSGEGGLPTLVCVTALLKALRTAQGILAELDGGLGDTAGFREVEILELYEDRAIEIWHAIEKFVEDRRADFDCEPKLLHGEGGRRRVTFENDPTWYQPINIAMDASGRVEPRMTFVVPSGMARAEAAVLPTHKEFVDRFIESAIVSPASDPARGSPGRALFELLLPAQLKEHTRDDRPLRLILDADCAAYPWELVDDRRPWDDEGAPIDAKERKPPALRAEMIRQLVRQNFRQRIVRAGKGKALVVGDPRGDRTGHYNPLPAAIDEARAVAELLQQAGFDVTELIGEKVTADEVVIKLCAQDWRIIHFASHGIVTGQQGSKSTGIVLGREMILTADMLRQLLPFSPDLVFVNCCYLGKMDPNPARSQAHLFAASIAASLIEMGVTAVVAAGWAVDDLAAQRFAEDFYRQVLDNIGFGQAVLRARQSTYDAYPSSTTWGAYQCYGEPDWRLTLEYSPLGRRRATFASVAEVVNAADQIRQDAQTLMAREPAKELENLKALWEEAERRGWADRSDLLTSLAAAYGELGDLERACDLYQKAIESPTGTTSLRAIEQLANLRVRASVRRPRKAGQDYEAVVASALQQLGGVIGLAGGTVERFSLQGACHKRLAQVRTGERRSAALMAMADCYRKADEEARGRGKIDPYPILMCVVARVAMECRVPTVSNLPLAIRRMVEHAEREAEQQDREDPSFWSAVPRADARLLKALAKRSLAADERQAVGDAYLKNWNRGGSWLKFQSVLEQLDFFIDVWDDGDASTEEKRIALCRELVILRDTLSARIRQV